MTRMLSVMLPVHKREKVAQIASNCLQRILSELSASGIDSNVVVVGSESWAKTMAKSKGWDYLDTPNRPLGRKFDKGAKYILDKWGAKSTHFMEWCSDNIASTDFTELLKSAIIEDSSHCITTNQFYILNGATGKARLFAKGPGSNVGRLTRIKVLRAMNSRGDGRIYCHERQQNLDASFRIRMQRVTGKNPELHKIAAPYIIDVKDANSLHSWASFDKKPDRFPLVDIQGDFPEHHQIPKPWQPQAKSGQTSSTSTSATTSTARSTTRAAMTPLTSSPAAPAAPSAASSKPSTQQAKTTTARAPSSSAQSTGTSAPKASSSSTTPQTKSEAPSSSTSGRRRRKSESHGRQASQETTSTSATATSPATKKAQGSTKSPATASPSKATATSTRQPPQPRLSTAKKKRRK